MHGLHVSTRAQTSSRSCPRRPNVTTHKTNASHFLFNSDLPLSPRKTARGGAEEGRGNKKREGGRGGREERKNGGAGGLLLLLAPYLLSHSLYFFSSCSSKGGNHGQSFATSSLQRLPFTRFPARRFAQCCSERAAAAGSEPTGGSVLDLGG